jgi:uncharacterized Rossmann fold enzyme
MFTAMLRERDWTVAELAAGTVVEDLIATDPDGGLWSVEVKNQMVISHAHRRQAQAQAKARRLPWMLASKIAGTDCWLVQRQGMPPVVWGE